MFIIDFCSNTYPRYIAQRNYVDKSGDRDRKETKMRYIRSTQFLLSSVVFAHFELLTIRNGNIDHGELDYFVGWIALLELDKYTLYPRSTVVQCLLLTATPNYSRTQRSCHRRHQWSKCVNEKRTCLFISRLARGSTLFVRVFRTFFFGSS